MVKIKRPLFTFCIALLAAAVLMVSACSRTTSVIRKVTYPPDFKYVSEQDLRSHMDQLAFQLQRLDQALAKNSTGPLDQQQEVLGILHNMEQIANQLQAGKAGSNHPFLQNHMNDFVSNVGEARIAASLSPPRYYLAGRITGGCVGCHKINR